VLKRAASSRIISVKNAQDTDISEPAKNQFNDAPFSSGIVSLCENSQSADKTEQMTHSNDSSEKAYSDENAQNIDKSESAKKIPNDAAFLSKKAREIIYGHSDDSDEKKEMKKEKSDLIKKIVLMFPVLLVIEQFLKDCYYVFDSKNIDVLDALIAKYKDSNIEALSQYASGLADDYEAVKNSLIFSKISNGPLEGMNNKIKMIHRRSYGRAGNLLLTGYIVLR